MCCLSLGSLDAFNSVPVGQPFPLFLKQKRNELKIPFSCLLSEILGYQKKTPLGFAGSPTWLGVAGYSEEWYLIVSLSDPSLGLCLFSVIDYFLSFNFFLFVVHIINNINRKNNR